MSVSNDASKAPLRKRIALALFSVALSVVCLEILLRFLGVHYPIISVRDPHRGWAHRPNTSWLQRDEGVAQIQINSRGFRDSPRQLKKPEDTIRIGVFGDSYVDAVQIERDDRFTDRLQRQLNSPPMVRGKRVEVLNFGVSGYGTAQEFQTWKHEGQKYSLDLAVLAFLSGNDVRTNCKTLDNNNVRPYFIMRDGRIELDESFRTTDSYEKTAFERSVLRGVDYSRLLQLAYRARRQWQKRIEIQARKRAQGPSPSMRGGIELGLDASVYAPPSSAQWNEAWAVTEAILCKMHRQTTETRSRFLVVTLSDPAQVYPDAEATRQLCGQLGVDDLFYPDRRVAAVGDESGFRVFNLATPLSRRAMQDGTYFHGFSNTNPGSGHWNQSGHQAAAELIEDYLRIHWQDW